MAHPARFALVAPLAWCSSLSFVVIFLESLADAQSHFDMAGRPPASFGGGVNSDFSTFNGNAGGIGLGTMPTPSLGGAASSTFAANARGLGAFAGAPPAASGDAWNVAGPARVGARDETEHLQLLGLSAELTRQARFSEARAALAAAAQMTGGAQEVLAQADLLRWRMGLRQFSPPQVEEWLGFRRGVPGAPDPSAAASFGGLGEPSEPEWAEVPSSAPRTSLEGRASNEAGSRSRFGFGIAAVAFLVLLALFFLGFHFRHRLPITIGDGLQAAAPESIAHRTGIAEAQVQEEEPGDDVHGFDPALDPDDDFLAGLAGLDECQQLSGMDSHADSGCSGDGSSSQSDEGGHQYPEKPAATTTDAPAAPPVQESEERWPEDSCCGPRHADDAAPADEQPQASAFAAQPTLDDAGQSRRWGRNTDVVEADSETALAAVQHLLMEDEDWADTCLPLTGARITDAAADTENDCNVDDQQQRPVRWGLERQAVPCAEDEEDGAEGEGEQQEEQQNEEDQVLRVGPASGPWGSGDDEWEDVSSNGNRVQLVGDAPAQSTDIDHKSWQGKVSGGTSPFPSPTSHQFGNRSMENERRTVLLSQFLPGGATESEENQSAINGNGVAFENDAEARYGSGHEEEHSEAASGSALGSGEEAENAIDELAHDGSELVEDIAVEDHDPGFHDDETFGQHVAGFDGALDDEWAWGHEVETSKIDREAEEREAQEQAAAVKEFAEAWQPQQDVWFAGPSGPMQADTAGGVRSLLEDPVGTSSGYSAAEHLKKMASTKAPRPSAPSTSMGYGEGAADDVQEERGQYVYFASTDERTGRTWYPSNSTAGKAAEKLRPAAREAEQRLEDGFVFARPTRFRPTGCFVRLRGGAESFLPVEHMIPRTEAVTTLIKERMRSIKQLAVRELDEENVTMLSEKDGAARANEIEARRKLMDEGIAVLRESYDSRKWIKGSVSAVQTTGVYVSVIAGKDAFVPVAEMPTRCTAPMEEEDGDKVKPTLEAGQTIDFRVTRHSWQTDSFVASMLSYEESVARRQSSNRSNGGAYSTPAAARTAPAEPMRQHDSAGSSGDRHLPQSPDLSKSAKKLAEKGFSFVSSSTASELNDWLTQSTLDAKNKASNSKLQIKNEKTFIVNIVRGMAGKVVGQLKIPTRCSEKEIKDEALAMVQKAGEIKAGQEQKGISIAKNIITVKL